METFFRGIIRFRWLVIGLVLGSTVLIALPIQTLRFDNDVEAMFPFDDPILAYSRVVEERFGIRDLIMIGVLNDNADENGVFNPRTLGIVKEFSERLALQPGIKAIRDEDVASIATMDNITGTVDGINVDPFMEAVPDAANALADLKQAIFANHMFVNWVVSQDGTGLLIMAKMEPAEDTQAGTARRMTVYTSIRDMVEAKKATGVPEEFHIAGRGAVEVTLSEEEARDMETFLPLTLVVLLGTLYCTYRSLRGVLLPLAVVVVSVIWTLGIMAALGIPMYFVTSIMPVVLMAIGVADGIHILSRYYEELLEHPDISSADAVIVTMREMWQPVILTSLTTAAGFLSFLTATVVPIRYFGVFSGVGILAAMLFSLTFFPAMLSLLSPTVSRGLRNQMSRSGDLAAAGWAASFLARLGRGVARRPLVVWVPAALVVVLCVLGTQRIVVNSTMVGMFHPSHELRVSDMVLRDTFQGTVPIYVAIEGHEPDRLKDPVLLDQLDRLQTRVEQDPDVGGSLSLAEYIKRMNRVMNEDRAEMEVTTSRDLVAQYLLLYSFSGDPDDRRCRGLTTSMPTTVYLRSDRTRDVERVVQLIRDFAVEDLARMEPPTLPPMIRWDSAWAAGWPALSPRWRGGRQTAAFGSGLRAMATS